MDFFRRNLLTRPVPSEGAETVVLDWAYLSIGAIGEDLVSLIVASVAFYEIGLEYAHELEVQVLEGYLEGLREAGWHGDAEIVRQGYAAAGALRYGIGVLRFILPSLLDPQFDPESRHPFGPTVREALAHGAEVHRRFPLRLAGEVYARHRNPRCK